MATAATTHDAADTSLSTPTGPALPEHADGSPIAVNPILVRKRTPNAHRGRMALVAGFSFLALLAIGAGALTVLSHPSTQTSSQPPLAVQNAPNAVPTSGAATGAAVAPPASTATEPGTTYESASAVTPAAPVARRRALSPPATAPMPGAGPSDAAPSVGGTAPLASVPPKVAPQPETPPTVQLAPIVGPTTAPAPPPAQPVTPQTAAPATPQPVSPQATPQLTPQAASDDAAPPLAKLPLSALMAQRT